jgi:hypothetical protein
MSLLQMYPLESAGGTDSILQTAVELRRRREEESKATMANTTLGSRLRDTIWKGFTNQNTSPPSSPEMSDSSEEVIQNDGDETETPSANVSSSAPSLTSRFANVFWQGITNQSAMDVPPSPDSTLPSSSVSPLPPSSPVSPLPSPSPSLSPSPSPLAPASPISPTSSTSAATSSWWSYASKLRDSDAAASLSKVSTNWRVKAIQAWDKTPKSSIPVTSDASHVRRGTDPSDRTSSETTNTHRERSFSDAFRSETYSPPPRPSYFRPPRDSMLPQPRGVVPAPTSPDSGDDTLSTQSKGLRDSLASLAGLAIATPAKPSPKAAPRPLLLNSSSLLTRSTPSPHLKGDSLSSITPPASEVAMKSRRHDSHSEWESDTMTSRIIPLNRRSISPMAPQFRMNKRRPQSSSSEKGTNGQDLLNSPSARSDGSAGRGWSRIDGLDSPNTLPASPPLRTPPPPIAALSRTAMSGTGTPRSTTVISEPSVRVLEAPIQARKLVRKKTPPPSRLDYTSDSSAAHDVPPLPSPRQRAKRIAQHLATIHIQKGGSTENSAFPNTLAPPELLDDHDSAVTPRAAAFYELNEQSFTSSTSPTFPVLPPIRTRKLSSEGRKASADNSEPRARKISSGHSPRTRKASDSRSTKRAESAAEEGDDEGYDELLSAYESEDSVALHVQH